MTEKFRAFFAVELTDAVHYEAVQLIKYLKKQLSNIKWTKPEKLHITMRFLGNISLMQYEKIVTEVTEAITNIQPFSIKFTDLIMFPSPEKPVAIALKPEPLALLIKLNQLLENAVIDCEVKPEPRAFLPHLTLGKTKCKHHIELPQIELPEMQLPIEHVTLFKSDAGVDGSQYTPLICISL